MTHTSLMNHINTIHLRSIHHSKFDADWHSTLHSHAFTELFYVIRGTGRFIFQDNTTINVREDDLVLVNPNILHTEFSDSHDPLEYIVVAIDGIEFVSEYENDGFSVHNYYEYKHEVLYFLKSLVTETRLKEPYHEMIVDLHLKSLIISIVRRTILNLTVVVNREDVNNDCIFIENYINKNFRDSITLDKLAELTFLNKYYISHIFKKHSGMSPIDFVLNKRITEAKRLLESTDYSISQISAIVGFSSPSYFSQFFKKEIGMGPRKYKDTFQPK
ncbi:helix-turn-helix transcriptional regulator [Erysipelothrix anatis]|uniref:helix-turn-helix transcriptional regulator n=1 Tax=Erysipelothrix anatis TaxID=2683713 RepID=UPI00140DC8C3|nr:AraC family transcriptional regulator [Erysipelothrix anatis]